MRRWGLLCLAMLVCAGVVAAVALGAGSLTATPDTLTFGSEDVGHTTAAQATVIKNTDASPVTIESVTTDNADFGVAFQTGDCDATAPTVLAQDEECTVHVTFSPSTTGPLTGTLTVASSGDDAAVALSGTGTTAGISAAPTSLAFGSQSIGAGATPNQATTITNHGAHAVTLGTASIDSADYAFDPQPGDCTDGQALASGATCDIHVVFDPTITGPANATLTVPSSANSELVTLSGTGTEPVIEADPTGLTFTQDVDDAASTPKESTVTNTGSEPVTISGETIGGSDAGDFAFAATGNTCTSGTTLGVGDTCDVRVEFDPTTTGAKAASVSIESNAPTIAVDLTGNATQTELSRSPGDLSFGSREIAVGPSAAQEETITNSGTEPVTFVGIGVTGDSGDFPADGATTCTNTTTLNAGQSCVLAYAFDPTTTGAKTATVTVDSNAPDVSFDLTGTGISTKLTATPTALSFGSRDIDDGATAAQESTITNSGTEDVSISSVGVTGDFARVTGDPSDCGSTTVLTPGQTCKVRVTFDPASTGAKTGTATVQSNAPDVSVDLSGTGIQTELSRSPATLAFGKQDVDDDATAPMTETITNSGTEPVTLTGAATTGTDAADFTRVPPTGSDCTDTTTLTAGQSCTLRYTFDPATVGSKSATVTVTSNADDVTFGLTGEGTQTELTAAPDSLSFGSKDVDDGSTAAQDSTVTNTGTEDVTISSVGVTGDFNRVTGNASDCGSGGTTLLHAGDTCKLRLRFDPTATGARAGTATVHSNAPDEEVALSGTGIQTELTPSPDTLPFGSKDIDDGPTSAQTSTITNTGTEPVDVSGVALGGTNPGQFELLSGQAEDCSSKTTIAAGETCEVRARFDPTTVGAKSASVSIPGRPEATVSLTGTGIQTELTPSPDTLAFGSKDIDDGATAAQESTVTNTGTEDVTITSVTVGGTGAAHFARLTGNGTDCGTGVTTLQAGETCKVRAEFDPSSVGAKTASITVASNAPDISIALTGTGTQTELTPTPDTLAFGSKDIDDGPTSAQTSTITNTGTEPVDVSGIALGGTNPGQFELLSGQAEDCSSKTTITAGQTCEVRARFDPTTVGAKSASVTIPGRPEATVSLTGTGIQTELSRSPGALAFGDQDIDAGPTAPQTSTVTNSGTEPVTIAGVSVGGDERSQFQRQTGAPADCAAGTLLAAGQTCDVRVAFDPSWEGPKSATVSVTSNAPTITIALTGDATQSVFPSSDSPLEAGYVTNGQVNAVGFDSAGRTYLGGTFTSVGPRTGHAVKLTATDDQADPSFPQVDGNVNAVAPDGSGGWLIGGSFTSVGGVPRANLARIGPTGTLDNDWNPSPNGAVNALAVSGATVYVGGDFTEISGESRIRAARLSLSGAGSATGWNPEADGSVRAIAVGATGVYLGGSFAEVRDEPHLRLAKVSASLGVPVAGWAADANGNVNAIEASGSDVYVGGSFTQIGGQPRNRIAKLADANGAVAAWNPNANGDVNALLVDGSDVYAGGPFTQIGGQTRNAIARLSASTGLADGWNPNANGTVSVLRLSGSDLYVGGLFTQIGGQQRNRIARLSTATGSADTWDPNANAAVLGIAVDGSDVYIGGVFTSTGATARNRLARLLPDGTVDPDWNPDSNNTVNALVVDGAGVYLGGAFTQVAGQTRNRLAKVSTGSPAVLDAWDPNASSTVNALALSGPDMFVGGLFTQVGGQPRNRIAKVAATGVGAVNPTWNPGASASVLAFAVSGGDLFVGGNFIKIDNQDRFFLAKLSTGGAGAADPNWKPEPNSAVRALVLADGALFAGGDFTSAGAQQRNRLVKLSTSGAGLADMGWNADVNAPVRALAVSGKDLYAGGDFTLVGGKSHGRVARLAVGDGGAHDLAWDPVANGTVHALAATSTHLAAGGAFTTVFGRSQQGIAVFDLPRLSRDPSSQQFGSQNVGAGPTAERETTVTNTSADPVAFSSVTLAGSEAGEFERLTGDPGDCTDSTTLATGESCTVRVRFDPTSTGAKAAWVSITASNTAEATIGLAGSGSLTQVEASPDTLAFGKQDVDDGPALEQTSALANTGSETVNVTGLDISGAGAADYTRLTGEPNDCFVGRELLAGQSCDIRVEFDPSVTGSRLATVTATFDAAGDETVSLTGEGTQTLIESDTGTLAFGNQDIDDAATAPQEATISNTGTEDVTLSAVTLGGSDPSQFSRLTGGPGDCAASTVLHAGDTCKVRVEFDPSTVGAKSATVTVDSNAADVVVSLTGTGTQTELSRSPASLSFGSQDIDDGATASQTSVVTNSGSEAVSLTGVEVTGDFAQVTGAGTDCSASTVLTAGQTCNLRITFDPSSVGSKSGTATVHSNAADVSVALDGTGIQTSASRSPDTLAFGDQDIDDGPTAAQESTVTNTGTETITLSGVSLGGSDAAEFERPTGAGTDCTSSTVLAAGEACKVRVRFDPSSTGSKSATVTVTSDDVPDLTIALTGRGTQTLLTRSPDSFAFGGQDIDVGPTAAQTSTVTNSGSEPVSISSVAIGGSDPGEFERLTDEGTDCTSSTVLTAGQKCNVRVRFDPTSVGSKSASVTVASNAPSISIALTGTGTQTEIDGSPDTLAFGKQDVDDGATAAQEGTVTNTGTEDVTLGSVGLEGTDAGEFERLTGDPGDCAAGTLLHQNDTCAVRVDFDPSTVGAKSATAKVSANGVDVTFSLTGTGTQTELSRSPTSLSFGDRDIDDGATSAQEVTVTNSGTEDVSLSGFDVTGDFARATGNGTDCTTSTVLTAGQTCKLRITFDPASTGSKTGTATVHSNAADVSVSLSGTGTQTELSRSPTSLSFGSQDVDDGATSAQEVTVTNSGTEDVSLSGFDVTGDFARATGQGTDCTSSTVLTAGQTCKLRITFDPASTGAKSGTATVHSNAADVSVSLSGTGTQTELSRSPSSLSFGDRDVDDGATATQASVVTNSGTESVSISSVGVTGDFAQVTGAGSDCTSSTVLTAGQTCNVRITFDPASTGSKSGTATVHSNAADVSVSLSGTGTQTELSRSPSSLSFGNRDIDDGATSAQEVTVTNSGTEDVSLSGFDVTGDFARATGQGTDCTSSTVLAAGQTCKLRLTFDPASTGSKSGSATVHSNAADVSVALSGTGTQTQLSRSPTSLAFGDRDVDDGASSAQEATITNSGTESVSIASVDVSSSEFARLTGNASDCTSSTVLTAGQTCKVRVTFDPLTTGPKTGSVTIDSNAPDVTIGLSGEGIQTSLSRSPASRSFGNRDIDDGPTASQDVTVTNNGTETVHLDSLSIGGTDAAQFERLTGNGTDCTTATTLNAGDTCTIRLRFDPSSTGAKSATLTIGSAEVPDLTTSLSGTGTQTQLSRSPTSLSFGNQDIDDGATSARESTVTNSGTEAVSLSGFDVTGDFARATGQGTDCTSSTVLNAGQTCKLRVTFDPGSTGAKSGSATVHSNAADVSVSLSGTGTQTLLTRSPGSLSFGNKDIDDGATASQTSVVTNSGTESVSISSVGVTGDFAQVTGAGTDCTSSTVLAAGQTCNLRVTFDPTATGARVGAVTVQSNAADVTVSLNGTGIQTQLSRSPASLAFGNQDIDDGSSATQESTVTNSGTQNVSIASVNMTGDSGDFIRQTGNASDCRASTVLTAGQTCKLRVAFNPTTVGSKSATATIHSNAADVSVALSGSGIQTQLSRTPTSLSFGNQDVDDGPTAAQESTVTNTGTQPVTISGLSFSGAGASQFERLTGAAGDCAASTSLAAGGTCKVRVHFDPSTTGAKSATLTVDSNADDVTVAVSGTGIQTELATAPTALDFGKRDIDDGASGAKESTITNTGSQRVTISGVQVTGPFARTGGAASDCAAATQLDAGDSCKVRATFDPPSVGGQSGTATVSSDAGDIQVALSGTGTQTSVAQDLGGLDFGNQDVDDGPTSTQEATVANTGTEPVTISGVSIGGSDAGAFETVGGGASECAAGATIDAGQSCKLRVRFDPPSTGAKSGTATVATSAGDLSFGLSGTGIQTDLSRTPTALSFGNLGVSAGPSAAQESTFTNNGTQTIAISGVSVGGADASDFALASGTPSDCAAGTSLAAGATCKVRATFDPATAGAKAATVSVASDAGPDSTVTLAGTGVPTLTIGKIRASARSTRSKKLKVSVSPVGGPLKGVVVTVTRRGRKVGSAKRVATLSRKKTVTVKLRRPLARGSYVAVAKGKDALGNAVSVKRTFRLR